MQVTLPWFIFGREGVIAYYPILHMLEVIESDFSRTVSKTEEAEGQADDDHLKFTTETQSSLAEKNQATVVFPLEVKGETWQLL